MAVVVEATAPDSAPALPERAEFGVDRARPDGLVVLVERDVGCSAPDVPAAATRSVRDDLAGRGAPLRVERVLALAGAPARGKPEIEALCSPLSDEPLDEGARVGFEGVEHEAQRTPGAEPLENLRAHHRGAYRLAMAARTIFHTPSQRRQVLGNDMMSYGPDRSEVEGWLPPDATVNPKTGAVTLPAKYVNPNGTPIPGEKLNPDGSLTIPDPYAAKPVAPAYKPPAAPVTPPPAKVETKKAGSSAYLIPLALIGATALGGYLLLSRKPRR